MKFILNILVSSILLLSFGCDSKKSSSLERAEVKTYKGFEKVEYANSGLKFMNVLKQDLSFNFLNYPYIYSGAGLAVGDIDNDGLDDIYLVSNFESNKLYKNKGELEFEDITDISKTGDFVGFSTGASMMDINADGYLDIYVCKAGSLGNDEGRRNLVYINLKDGTFKEEGKRWGLADPGYSTQAYQLDFDNDGDLDIYIVNHRYDFKNNGKISTQIQRNIEDITSDQLYRNDGDKFSKITQDAGLLNKTWGLSASIGDFNEDGWTDIFVANDFLEPDFLYINQKDGSFKDEGEKYLKHISFNSMGSDFADFNNDLKPDLITLDMMAEEYARSKENMASMSIDNFNTMVQLGYNHAYMANMLNLNRGNGKFQEIGQLSGITKTDWSWAPLFSDFNNDGLKDIFISNGVIKDYTNQDFRNNIKRLNSQGKQFTLEEVSELLPAEKLRNYLFMNTDNLKFINQAAVLGLEEKTFSNGAAYSDLDNDGDLDIIINNHEDYVSLFENKAENNYLKIKLKGPNNNPMAIGATVTLIADSLQQNQHLYTARGYESSVSSVLNFGLGARTKIDTVEILWMDGTQSQLSNVKSNSLLKIDYSNITRNTISKKNYSSVVKEISQSDLGINFSHVESGFDDYKEQLLLPQKQSTKGSNIVVADFNGDGKEDFFVGNAAGSSGMLFIQSEGVFKNSSVALWESEKSHEDGDAIAIDIDNDGDLDLIITSAGYEFDENSPLLNDRIYLNDGIGHFLKSKIKLPYNGQSTKAIAASDFDGDGDMDVFVGGNVLPQKYPLSSNSYFLINDKGTFKDNTLDMIEDHNLGIISSAKFADIDSDGDEDLITVGEWNGVQVFENTNGKFSPTANDLASYKGWWQTVTVVDIDGDGDLDILAGNIGNNNKFQPKKNTPIFIYSKDFDSNGSYDVALTKFNNGVLVPVRGKECSSEQSPFLLDKIKTYKEFANLNFEEIYGEERLEGANKLDANFFESVLIENKGRMNFEIHKLPNLAQGGPTMAFMLLNKKDDHTQIIGAGGLYDAEVETIRYDANYGYAIEKKSNEKLKLANIVVPILDFDVRDLASITVNGKQLMLVLSNNDALRVFEIPVN
jgi:hypothetical protein